jgi:hypothetical protein
MSDDLKSMTVVQLKEKAKSENLSGYSKLKKDELIKLIVSGKSIPSKRGKSKSPKGPSNSNAINSMTVVQLKERAKLENISGYSKMNKAELINALTKRSPRMKSPERKVNSLSPKAPRNTNKIEHIEIFHPNGDVEEHEIISV